MKVSSKSNTLYLFSVFFILYFYPLLLLMLQDCHSYILVYILLKDLGIEKENLPDQRLKMHFEL